MGTSTVALADEEKKLVPKDVVRQLRSEGVSWLVGGVVFLASAAPVFGRHRRLWDSLENRPLVRSADRRLD
jgi:hypothetical protein